MKLSISPKRLMMYLVGLVFVVFNLVLPATASAQLTRPGITHCDIESFQYVHSAYDDCGPLIAATQACLTTTVVGTGNEQITYNFLVSHGLSPVQAAGVMGNLSEESSFRPEAHEKGGTGIGIAQWSFGRHDAIEKAAADAGIDINSPDLPNLMFQLQYLYNEANQRGDWARLKSETTVEGAALSWHKYFERSADNASQIQERVRAGSGFLAKYGSGAAPTASFSSGCASSSTTGTNIVAAPNCPATGITYHGQYTEQQLRSLFGPPVRETHANVTSVNFLGSNVEVNKVIAPCLAAVSAELVANGITYKPEGSKGGFFCLRDNDGQIGDRSYHIYGAACDFNPYTNNYYGGGSGVPFDPNCPNPHTAFETARCFDMPSQVVSAFEHHGFYWGGNFSSIKDYMHFEWHGASP